MSAHARQLATSRPQPPRWPAFTNLNFWWRGGRTLAYQPVLHPAASTSTACRSALLADDRRGPWQPAAGLDSLWQRLRLMVITQLWDAYCRARSHGQSSQRRQAHIAARVISAARSQMRRETGCLSAQTFGSELGCLATGSGNGMTAISADRYWIHSATRSGGNGKRCIRYNMTT